MAKKLAVAVIHGIGSQGETKPPKTDQLVFSRELRDRTARELGQSQFDANVAWREIFWSDILQERQNAYLAGIKRRTRGDKMRSFILCNLADASAYRKTGDPNDTTYEDIHARVKETIKDLEGDVEPHSPLIVLAHSLGGHIMSNYIYDAVKTPALTPTRFQQLKTMGGFVTFGCNIPLFTFAYRPNKVFPIKFPGTDLPADKRFLPWWLNFYDKDDVLGYPLKDIGPNYARLIDRNELRETAINAGGALSFWNPLSHNGYWRDDDFYRPLTRFLKKFL